MMPFTHKNPNRTVIVRGGKPTNCSKLPASISINDEGTCVQVPLLSGDRVFWTVSEDEVLLSDSASRLASITNADLDLERIVMDLLPSLPDSLRGDKSPWRNIHSIPAATILHLDKSNRPRYTRAEPSPAKHVPSNEILASLRSRFLTIADEWRNEAPLSADVSGGVDSAAITYVFASEGVRMPLYHETPDDPMNQDSRWAERISEDVRMPLIKIGRVVDGNRSFEPAAEYPNREIPEEPVYWSDIEGYLSRISEMETDASRIHVTGFGGDELFASMPSSSWSCLREHPLRLRDIRRQYSADYRVPPYQAILDLTDSADLHEELRSSFLDAEQGHDHRSSPCGWHDAIRIPEFLTAKARNILYGAVESQLKHADIRPLNPDRSRHQALYSLSMQARMLNQVNRTFASNDITFRSPYLDHGIADYALCAPISARTEGNLHKAVLYRALKGIIPETIFRRPVKGDHSYSLYLAWQRSKDALLDSIAGGVLDEEGLIDMPAIRRRASMPMPDITFLFEMQRVAAVERWLRYASR